jgi:hypothetical protein
VYFNITVLLRRIFGPKRDEVTGEWWKLHNEELNDLYCSPSIVWVIKSRRVRWTGHIQYTGCPRRNVPDFGGGGVFLMLKYTDITLNTYIQS